MYAQQHDSRSNNFTYGRIICPYLSVEPDREDVVGVAVVANLCTFLKVIDVHSPRHGQTDHHHQAAGEQPLHYIDVRALHWETQVSVFSFVLTCIEQRMFQRKLMHGQRISWKWKQEVPLWWGAVPFSLGLLGSNHLQMRTFDANY